MYIVLLARYKSLKRFVLLPKLYVMFALGVILPATTKPARVPVLVMLGWAAVVNIPVTKLAVTKFPPAILLALKFPVNVTRLPPVSVKLADPLRTPESLY